VLEQPHAIMALLGPRVVALALCATVMMTSVGAGDASTGRSLHHSSFASHAGAHRHSSSQAEPTHAERSWLAVETLTSFALPLALALFARKVVLPRLANTLTSPVPRTLSDGGCKCRFCQGQCYGCVCCEHTQLQGRHCAC